MTLAARILTEIDSRLASFECQQSLRALRRAVEGLAQLTRFEVHAGWEAGMENPISKKRTVFTSGEYKGCPAEDALKDIARELGVEE